MMKWLVRIAIVLAIVFVAIQVIRPARTNPPTDPSRTIQTVMNVPAPVNAILQRSCHDCHSHDTRWPWYSNLAPMSWLVVKDVNEARQHMNFSEWAAYPPKDAEHLLEEMCEEVEKGDMPLEAYVLAHPSAKLSDGERQTLCAWAQQFDGDGGRGRNRGRGRSSR